MSIEKLLDLLEENNDEYESIIEIREELDDALNELHVNYLWNEVEYEILVAELEEAVIIESIVELCLTGK